MTQRKGQAKKVGIRVKNLYILEVDGISTKLPTIGNYKEDMQLKLEREQDLHAGKSDPRVVEQPQDEDHGVGATTHAEKFHARWAEGVHAAYHQVRGGATCMDNPKKRFLGRIH